MGALDDKPFGVNDQDGSMGDKDVAMKANPRYDGDNGQDRLFEGLRPAATAATSQVQFSGRQ
jgi:hypothetical protein